LTGDGFIFAERDFPTSVEAGVVASLENLYLAAVQDLIKYHTIANQAIYFPHLGDQLDFVDDE